MMRTVQTEVRFPLASVKPLDQLASYRDRCLDATQQALRAGSRRRQISPVTGQRLEPFGRMGGLDYARCPTSGSVFLVEMADPVHWRQLLSDVAALRRRPGGFHARLTHSRSDWVHHPKVAWIQETLRLQGFSCARLLEVTTPPGDLSPLAKVQPFFSNVEVADEMALIHDSTARLEGTGFDAVVLPESLDRVDEPDKLLRAALERLRPGGFLFMTSLVCSGFDMAVLGTKNLYWVPPDRANCFSLNGLQSLLGQNGLSLLEVSTPGVLDVEIVRAHLEADPGLPVSAFERLLALGTDPIRESFQDFLQKQGLSSFARLVGRKPE